MSDIPGELARVQGAYKQPTLTLLHQLAPVVIAIFRTSFSRDVRTIKAARLHQQVDTYLAELRFAGRTDVPTGTGRDLCLRWMRGHRQRAHAGGQTGGRVAFCLRTDDSQLDHHRLSEAGVTFTEPPRHEAYGHVAVFEDPFGNLWDLVGLDDVDLSDRAQGRPRPRPAAPAPS